MLKKFIPILIAALLITNSMQFTGVFAAQSDDVVTNVYSNDFEGENALAAFIPATGSYTEYASEQISEIYDEGGEHGKVWKISQGGGWNAFNQRYIADYSDIELSFDMRIDTEGEKAMIYVRGGEDGDSGYEVGIYNDRITLLGNGLTEQTSDTLPTLRGDGWNSYKIICEGSNLEVYMNDVLVYEYGALDPNLSGGIGFAGWRCAMHVDNIILSTIDSEVTAPTPRPTIDPSATPDPAYLVNDFEYESDLDMFVPATGSYTEYASEQISEIYNEGGIYGKVWKIGQGGGWNAFNQRYLADYNDMILSFDMKCDTIGEKAMIYVRAGEDGDSGYEVDIYNDRIAIQGNGLQEQTLSTLTTQRGAGWNSYRIICAGENLQVFMNGILAAEFNGLNADLSGGIAFAGWRCTMYVDNIKTYFYTGGNSYRNDFEGEDALADFVPATGGYAEYAQYQISEIAEEGGDYGKVWKLGQGGGWNAFNQRYLADYSDMILSFDMRCDNTDEKAMVYVRANEDGDSGYEIGIYNDRITIMGGGINQQTSPTLPTERGTGWNSYQIICTRENVDVYMNGALVAEFSGGDAELSGGLGFAGWRCTTWYDNIDAYFFDVDSARTSFTLNHEDITMSVGDIATLSTIYDNLKYKQHNDTWISSDDSVAEVSSTGVITAKSPGTTTITVTNYDNKTASCNVSVNAPCETFYYVSPDGNDETGDGSIDNPFATIARARDFLRTIELPDGGVTVYLRDGEYFSEETIVFTPEDSGEPGKPIVYSSYPEEKAVIHSGKEITGFELLAEDEYPAGLPDAAKGNVFVADIEPGWRPHDLYVNGVRQQVSRQFNTDDWQSWDSLAPDIVTPIEQNDPEGMVIEFRDGGVLKDLPDNGDIYMNLLPVEWWNFLPILSDIDPENATARIESFNPAIAPVPGEYFGWQLFQHTGPFNIMNAAKFLDEPGEWCVDSENGKVYWWPTNVNDLDNAVAPCAYELIRLQGDEEAENWEEQVSYIEFRNLTFMYNDRMPEDEWSDSRTNPQLLCRNAENTDAAIFMQGVSNCVVADSSILCTGSYAVSLDHYAQNVRIVRNEMGNLGSGGVNLAGYGPGLVDVNKYNTIVANNIYDTGLAPYMHSSAVTIYGSGYNDIKYNNIERTPYTAIMLTGADADSLNPAHFNTRAYSDTFGNMNTQYAIREDDLLSLDPSISSTFDTAANNGVTALPYQHSDHNKIEYNMATDYMLLMRDGGCYYAWGEGKNNEFNFNTAVKLDSSKGGSYPIYMDDYSLYVKIEGNQLWASSTTTADKSWGTNIWRDNCITKEKPEKFDELNAEITAVADSIGGYIFTEPDTGYITAPEIEGIEIAPSESDKDKTSIKLPALPDGADKFIMVSVTDPIDAPYSGDTVIGGTELTANATNEVSAVNDKSLVIYAIDSRKGIVAYANITAQTSNRYNLTFREDFEVNSLELLQSINDGLYGWSHSGETESTTIDYDTGSNSSRGLRVSNGGGEWWKSQWATLDVKENAAKKLKDQGVDDAIAEQLSEQTFSGDVKIEFDFKPSTQWRGGQGNVSNNSETYVRIADSTGNEFVGVEYFMPDNSQDSCTFSVVALNEQGLGTQRYTLYTGVENVEAWHHITIVTRSADNTFKILVDGAPVPGLPEWIQAANCGNVSDGAQAGTAKGVSTIKAGNYFSGWYQAPVIDNIVVKAADNGSQEFDGGSLTYSATSENNIYSVDAEITNSSSENRVYTIYIAEYSSDGALVNATDVSKEIGSGETADYDVTFEARVTADASNYVKMFIWDDAMRPATEAVVLH